MANERTIQITLQRPVSKGSNEQGKKFDFAFEGNLTDFEVLQRGINEVVEKILWDKQDNKTVETKETA